VKRTLSVLLSLLLLCPSSWAVKHIKPGAYPNAKRDMIHHPSRAHMAKFGSLHSAIIGTSTGAKKVAVILVQFQASTCGGCRSGNDSITNLAVINTYFTQMAAYFNEVSYGKLTLTFGFFGSLTPGATPLGSATAQLAGAYTLSHTMEYYGCGDEGAGCGASVTTPTFPSIGANGDYLIADALTAARNATGGPTSSASLGTFDAVVVVHAGNGNETTLGTNGDIWSIFYSQDTVIQSAGGGFDEGDVVPATESGGLSPIGVICHEFGHELGLPDLYNTGSNGGTSVVGDWELMDSGPYDGNGANPSHPGAWDKLTLGWATAQTISTVGGTFSLPYVETVVNGTNALGQILPPNGLPQEYFLLEYRSPSSGALFDRNIPGEGLIIWHIDDALTSSRGIAAADPSLQNTVNGLVNTSHYGASIVTADGVAISNTNQGDAANAYTNTQVFSSPQSDNFSAQPSGVTVFNIVGIGGPTATVEVSTLAVSTPGDSRPLVSKLVVFPNPAGKGYIRDNVDQRATIQFQLTRTAKDYEMNIYTLSGDLVRKIGKNEIPINRNRDNNYKWVYEFDWDLKNGNGAHVAPGVYLILLRVDGETKTTKAVVIR
jgi:M6 family metalloprotease-like protein